MVIDLRKEELISKIKLAFMLTLWTLIVIYVYTLLNNYYAKESNDWIRETETIQNEVDKVWYPVYPQEPVIEQTSVKVNEVEQVKQVNPKVKAFVNSYRGSRISDDYLNTLNKYCDGDTLKKVIAISVAESGMGRDLPNKQSNFYGWFKGGNKNYDPDQDTMAKDICTGVSTYYSTINLATAKRYTGNDRPTTWLNAVNWALKQM